MLDKSVFDSWDKEFDSKSLANDVKDIQSNSSDDKEYIEVPYGKYEVTVKKLAVEPSKKGKPTLKARFKVEAGKFKGNSFFMNQSLSTGFPIHKALEFLRSLNTDIEEIEFSSYGQFAKLVEDVRLDIDKLNLGFVIDYSCNNSDFAEFKVEEVFSY